MSGRSAVLVAAGILSSRVIGLVRQRAFAHYFGGRSDAGDAFLAAFRIPNFLQNLFGEGVLSASFIPVYANLVARGEREEADRVAGAVFGLLSLVTSLLVLAGVFAAPGLVDTIAAGFEGEKRDLTISLVRILFPGAGALVVSAWCLGILNSHRQFFLSYAAPVVWNVAMIATLLWFGGGVGLDSLARYLAWGSVVGSVLQFAVQLPSVFRLARGLRVSLDARREHVRTVTKNFLPAFVGRGVVQISAYVDSLIASLLPAGAVIGITNAQVLYTLPVSLFGMSMSAAELPAMASATGTDDEVSAVVRTRLDAGLRRIAYFIVPSTIAFLAFGDVIAAAVYQTGRFTPEDANYTWAILAGSSVGLLASTLGRLYSSAYYSLRDTKTPLKFAMVRVSVGTFLGYLAAVHGPGLVGVAPRWGVAGLTAASGTAGWIEFTLLRGALSRRIGRTGVAAAYLSKLWAAGLAGAALAWAVKLYAPEIHPALTAVLVLGPFGVTYLAGTVLLKIPEADEVTTKVARRILRRRPGKAG